MTAPLTRTVDKLSGDVIPAGAAALAQTLDAGLPVANAQLAELAKAQQESADTKTELEKLRSEHDETMVEFERLGASTNGITRLMNLFHSQRDSAREDAEILRGQLDDMRHRAEDAESLLEGVREERDWLTARVQELAAEERDAEARDAAVNDAADAAEAGESTS